MTVFRSFPQALLQCDQKLVNLLIELEHDINILIVENKFDQRGNVNEEGVITIPEKLKMRRKELRKTIKEVSKRKKLIKVKETKSNLKSAISLQLTEGMRTGR